MWRVLFFHAGFLTCVLGLSLTGPFSLQKAPAVLTNLAATASASASASSPPEPMTHIANLRRTNQKAQQLQAEKLPAHEDDPYAESSAEEADNEAAPSLLQKKVAKLLAKLRFISSLTGGSGDGNEGGEGGHEGNNTIGGIQSNITVINSTSTVTITPELVDVEISNDTKDTDSPQTFQKIIYPHSGYGPPIKLSFDVSERLMDTPIASRDGEGEKQKLEEGPEASRLGQIGVFFAEVVGSLVGLIYGAAVQFGGVPQDTSL